MKIAEISPLFESVPPKFYGGTERIVSYLTEELVRQGHEVTLFASGDSHTAAKLVAVCPEALRLAHKSEEAMAYTLSLLERVFSPKQRFDVIHSHLDFLAFPFARRHETPVLNTFHGRLDLPGMVPLFREYSEVLLTSISDAQRAPFPKADWQATVYHGLPLDLFKGSETPGRYLAFLGRLSVEKRVDRAIRIARAAGLLLKIAAKVDQADMDYYKKVVKPLFRDPQVEYVGEIADSEKNDFLGNAIGLLFPIEWPEPFGLVMIEAMACGTPVIAFRQGSVAEIVEDGVTGFVVDNEEQAIRAVASLPHLSRKKVRRRFEERFSDVRMAADYLAVYERMLSKSRSSAAPVIL